MQLYQNYVVFRSFSDLYVEEIRQESIKSRSSSTTTSRAGSISEDSGVAMMIPYGGEYSLSRNFTESSSTSTTTTSSSSSEQEEESQYYPAALYNSKMAQRESDTATLDDNTSFAHIQDLSLQRY